MVYEMILQGVVLFLIFAQCTSHNNTVFNTVSSGPFFWSVVCEIEWAIHQKKSRLELLY